MSQRWTQIQQLSAESIIELKAVFADVFPIEIRDHLSSWIEEQPWSQLNEDNEGDLEYALHLLRDLLQQIHRKARLIPHLKELAQQIENKYMSDPLCFIRDMKSCIYYEDILISRSEQSPVASSVDNTELDIEKLAKEFESLNNLNISTESNLHILQEKHEQFAIILQTLPQLSSKLKLSKQRVGIKRKADELEVEDASEIPEPQQKETDLRSQKEHITKNLLLFSKEILDLFAKVESTLQQANIELDLVKRNILDKDLGTWKYNQQLSLNGEPLDDLCIQNLQKRCECLARLIIKNIQHTLKLKGIYEKTKQLFKVLTVSENYEEVVSENYEEVFQSMKQSLPVMLIELITRTFIVDNQPPQILRKGTKFESGASFLVGNAIDTITSQPEVTVYIINEKQAQELVKGQDLQKQRSCGVLENNHVNTELQKSGRLSAKFTNLVLQRVERDRREGGKRVTEEKFCMVFETNIRIGEYALPHPVRVLSVPVIATTNVSQDCESLATIMWDHQFSTLDLTPFHVPEAVKWQSMAHLLNVKFTHETGRGLTEKNLNYIASKIFGKSRDYSNKIITTDMFCKDKIVEGSFTFWEWFYQILRLTTDHLKGLWTDGHIAGFISKTEVEKCLASSESGTFMCRFSDSKLGGVSVVHRKRKNGMCHTEPFTSKDLNKSSLPQIILENKKWTYLYPKEPKEEVLEKFAKATMEEQMEEGQTRYEKFIWTIKNICDCEDDGDDDTSEQDCLEILQELLNSTNDSQLVEISNETDMMI